MQYKYRVLIIFSIITALFSHLELLSQNISLPDSLVIFKKSGNDLLFNYKVEKGNTVYSISKFFDVDIMNIYGYNPQLQLHPLDINSNILVPFNIDILGENKKCKGSKVFYRVGVKDNLFRIARVYFHHDLDDIKKKNDLEGYVINPGQLLYIGDICKQAINSDSKEIDLSKKNKPVEEKIVTNNREKMIAVKERPVFVKKVEPEIEDKTLEVEDSTQTVETKEKILEDNGLAIWNKELKVKGVFVLHNDAKLYSLMELYNPVVNTSIVAKVIGRIPENTYPDNVKLILSPEAAESLGALDQRFFVRYKYLK
ncbi:MAG TPA: LysM domain-containing protein [Saprospiraceae bacterium]|nr:LysM domain-containing protein [Saprospiraceae bacterium]HHH52765.1 LysM domain-containing protein [Bacteroidota bacterium]